MRHCSSKVAIPPVPVPMITPTRRRSRSFHFSSRHESVTACAAAPMANCEKRSKRLTSFLSIQRDGSNPFTSQANLTGRSAGSKRVMGPAPDFPATRASHDSATEFPTGDTSPRPVTATRRRTYFPIFSWRYFMAEPTVLSFSASSSGMSMSNSFSKAITSSTVSRLSAPRSSMKLAPSVSLSRSTPSSSTMMSFTFSSSCFMSMPMGNLKRGVGKRSQHHPAVDDQHLSRNVAREVGGEKEHRRRDVRAFAQPAQRDGLDQGRPRLAGDGARELRIDEARRHRVHEHVARGQFLGHRLGEADQPRLRGGVIRLALVAGDADDAGDVDDAAPAPLDHAPRGVLGHQEGPLQIGVEDR